MNERDTVLALTRLAFLDAIILSLLSVQSVLPFVFLVMLWLAPIVFALEITLVPHRIAWVSGLVVPALALALLGLDIGLWASVYFVLGATLGMAWRLRLPWIARQIGLSVVFVLTVAAIFVIFGKLVRIDWKEISAVLEKINQIGVVPVLPAMIVGFVLWAIILSVAMDRLLQRVLRQISMEPSSL